MLDRQTPEPRINIQDSVRRFQTGERDAFSDIYTGLSPKIHTYLLRHVQGNQHLAEDLTADVFVKAYEKIDSYQDRGIPFAAWLYRIARNHLIDHQRGERSIASLELFPEAPKQTKGLTFEQQIGLNSEVNAALGQLNPDQRNVIEMRFLNELTPPETAEALGKTVNAVKKLQTRAIVNLRKAICSAREWEEKGRRNYRWNYDPSLDMHNSAPSADDHEEA